MFDSKFFDDLSKKLADSVPENVKTMKSDMEKHFRNTLQSVFAKMDLITREEFDIQALVLSKTRGKLEKLEQKMELLEKKLTGKTSTHAKKADS